VTEARGSDPRPIAVFDSGVGGLTVLAEIRRRLPEESTLYLGDSARAPYGPRPADEVRAFTREAVAWLQSQDIKVLVLACNTATSQALPAVRANARVPVLGVVRPGAVAAAAATRSGHVGVVATAGTVNSAAYPAAIAEADPRLTVTQQACPDLVPLVEAGTLTGPSVTAAVGGYLEPLLAEDPSIDTLLLGCTHYPLLRTEFERLTGPGVAVVDSAFTTALALEDLLDVLGNRAPAGNKPLHRLTTTGPAPAFAALAERLFDGRVGTAEEVAIRLRG